MRNGNRRSSTSGSFVAVDDSANERMGGGWQWTAEGGGREDDEV